MMNQSTANSAHPTEGDRSAPDKRKVGMACFIMSEIAFFSTLLTAYALYIGKDLDGPTPADTLSLHLALLISVALFSSSFTIWLALRARSRSKPVQFRLWWLLTIVLGAAFIAGTAVEWDGLIFAKGLTIDRNLFGSTYFTVVGFHALHVTMGLVVLSIIVLMDMFGALAIDSIGPELISWYWHFVDGVWVFVLTLVYFISTDFI